MPSPAFRINGGSVGVKASVSAGATVTATLDSTDGVRSVSWSVIGTDETRTAASYTLTQSGSVGQTVQLTAGAAGTAGILRCQINGGVNLQTEQADATTRATAKWYVPTAAGAEVGCVNEQLESNSTHGWTGLLNSTIRGVVGTVTSVTAAPPLSSTGGTTPQISISAASGASAGSMSAAHFSLVDGATENSTASTLARRTSGGALRADWFESDGGGTVATTGGIRLPANGSAYGVVSGSDARVFAFSGSSLLFGSSLATTAIRTTENGVIELQHGAGSTPFFRILSSGTCGDVGEVRVDTDGRIVCWVESESAEGTTLTEHDAIFHATDKKTSADAAAGDATAMFPVTGPMQRAAALVAVHFVPTGALTANDTNYARIDVFAVDGAGTPGSAIASVTTQITGGSGNWTANVPVSIPVVGAGSIPSGSHIAWAIAKPGGTGVQVPAGRIDAQFRYDF